MYPSPKLFSWLFLTLFWTACTYTQRIQNGNMAFERKQFALAIPMLQKEYNKAKSNQEKGEKAYFLAESYRLTHQPSKAREWYEKAIGHRYAKDTGIRLAQMLQMEQRYDEALKAYQAAGRDKGDVNTYRLQMQACKNAKQWLSDSAQSLYRIENLPFNSAATDFAPQLYQGQLLFASDRNESQGKDKYKWTGKKFFDLYQVQANGQGSPKRWEISFNGKYHQGTLSFTADSSKVFFTSCGSDQQSENDYCLLYESRRNGSTWSEPKALAFTKNMSTNYFHPFVSPDGRHLIFSANLKSGFGGYDLYRSTWIEAEQRWSEPKNLGSVINTAGNEVFPFMDADTLYFSSDGHPGMGGLDLFRVEQQFDQWRSLSNLKAPMNSGGDDFGLVVDYSSTKADTVLQQGYFTSSRPQGGKGSDDIYRFERRLPPAKLDTPPAKLDTPLFTLRIRLEGLTLEQLYKDPRNAAAGIEGSQALANVSIQVLSEDTAFIVGSDEQGRFATELKPGKLYSLKASKNGYFNQELSLSTEGISQPQGRSLDTLLQAELRFDKILLNQEIVLENIYYDYNKCDIRADARPTLDSLSLILKKNPNIKIQLASHTDCRGTTSYNEKLSQCRAESAVQYLINTGIEADRMRAKGFGESQPAASCVCERCTEEEHQKNRRTTFMVLE